MEFREQSEKLPKSQEAVKVNRAKAPACADASGDANKRGLIAAERDAFIGQHHSPEVMAVGEPDSGTTTDTGLLLAGVKVNCISQLDPATSVAPPLVPC